MSEMVSKTDRREGQSRHKADKRKSNKSANCSGKKRLVLKAKSDNSANPSLPFTDLNTIFTVFKNAFLIHTDISFVTPVTHTYDDASHSHALNAQIVLFLEVLWRKKKLD